MLFFWILLFLNHSKAVWSFVTPKYFSIYLLRMGCPHITTGEKLNSGNFTLLQDWYTAHIQIPPVVPTMSSIAFFISVWIHDLIQYHILHLLVFLVSFNLKETKKYLSLPFSFVTYFFKSIGQFNLGLSIYSCLDSDSTSWAGRDAK